VSRAVAIAVLLLSGCGAVRAPDATKAEATATAAVPQASAAPAFDECKDSGPVPRVYEGILRGAKCDQQRFLIMASVAEQLGVECSHCHAPTADPKKQDYPVMTPRKEIANWMSQHLMQAVKHVDGSPMRCKSCHTDENGKPVAKIFGEPRDPAKAYSWMASVMVNRFVAADGSRLTCRSCHIGTVGTPAWQPKVIFRSEQLPKHEVAGKAAF
jgi:hypothetical protein